MRTPGGGDGGCLAWQFDLLVSAFVVEDCDLHSAHRSFLDDLHRSLRSHLWQLVFPLQHSHVRVRNVSLTAQRLGFGVQESLRRGGTLPRSRSAMLGLESQSLAGAIFRGPSMAPCQPAQVRTCQLGGPPTNSLAPWRRGAGGSLARVTRRRRRGLGDGRGSCAPLAAPR